MGKLNTVKNKVSFEEYLEAKGLQFHKFDTRVMRALSAYCDCLPENVDTTGMERNLDFFQPEAFNLKLAFLVLSAAVPDGYNDFKASSALEMISQVFGENAKVYLAREGSVCIYVKPSQNVRLEKRRNVYSQITSDEFSFEADLGMFRLWWD